MPASSSVQHKIDPHHIEKCVKNTDTDIHGTHAEVGFKNPVQIHRHVRTMVPVGRVEFLPQALLKQGKRTNGLEGQGDKQREAHDADLDRRIRIPNEHKRRASEDNECPNEMENSDTRGVARITFAVGHRLIIQKNRLHEGFVWKNLVIHKPDPRQESV